MAAKLKTNKKKSKARTKPRVEDTEPRGSVPGKDMGHRKIEGYHYLSDGEMFVGAQLSELVPVAQYASVTLGPVKIEWRLSGIDMEKLIDVEWPEDPEEAADLTDEQAEVFDRVAGAVQASTRVLEAVISEDRVTVERSVQQHNEREEAEKEKKSSSKGRGKKK